MMGHMKCLNDNDDLQYTDLSLEAQNILANHNKLTEISIFSFLPQPLLPLPSEFMNKVAMVAGMRSYMGLV